jgi:exopolyphosphatase/guanosine-5'-triphosphate,3'-diphosphate pyrophosphatase
LPIGPLRLVDETGGDKAKLRKIIKQSFESIDWLKKTKVPEFYAIGGSFRAIARLHMLVTDYPLRILHQYTVPAADFAAFAAELASFPDDRMAQLPGISAKRVPSMAPAAMILQYVVSHIQPKHIVFSASGIREGYLYEKLPPYMRKQDGLLASCTDIVNRYRSYSHYAGELMVWMQPLLGEKESEAERRMRLSFCLLSDIAHHIHPEYRAEFAMQRILQSSFTCLSHAERVQLALALYHRYQFKLKGEPQMLSLLSPKAKAWARMVGSAANLAYHLTGGVDSSLHLSSLKVEKKNVKLLLSKHAEDLMGEAIAKRISGVQEAYKKWVS